jgi:CRISPR-associated endonuclease/helicase Cas3
MDYPETARNYHLINAGTHPVLVPWRKGAQIAENIIHKPYLSRNDFSMIQNYSVNLWSNQLTKALEYGLCSEIRSGLFEWIGEYDAKLGIVMKQQDLAKFVC